MTARFTIDAPLSAGSWPARPGIKETARIEAIWRENMKRRDEAAAQYGEPETPHEFYAGRPGSKAETIVLDCLRELRAIPAADRLYAKELTDAISRVYLETAKTSVVRMRRIAALLLIGAETTT
jgi:hypothetical protein